MDIRLDYGKEGLEISLPDHLDVKTLAYQSVTPIAQQPDQTDRQALQEVLKHPNHCLLYTSPSPRDRTRSRMPSSA